MDGRARGAAGVDGRSFGRRSSSSLSAATTAKNDSTDEGSSSSSNPTSPPLEFMEGELMPEELRVLSEPLRVKSGSGIGESSSFDNLRASIDNLRSPWLKRVSMSAMSLVQMGRDARSISFHGSPHRDGLVPRRSVSEAALHALEGRVSAAKYKAQSQREEERRKASPSRP